MQSGGATAIEVTNADYISVVGNRGIEGATALTTLTSCTNVDTGGSVADDSVTNAKLSNVATATFKGRTTSGTGDPEDLTATQATALLNTFTTSLKGLAPASGGGTSNYLRADGTWAAPAGGSFPKATRATLTANQNLAIAGVSAINWDAEDYDDGPYHDTSSNNNRFTNNTGSTKRCRLYGTLQVGGTALGDSYISVLKNASTNIQGTVGQAGAGTYGEQWFPFDTGWVDLANGDYLQVTTYISTGTSPLANKDNSFACFEVQA